MVGDISYYLCIVTFISFLGNGFAEDIQLTGDDKCKTYRMSAGEVNYLTWEGDRWCLGDGFSSNPCQVKFDAESSSWDDNIICIETMTYYVPCSQKTVNVQYLQGLLGSHFSDKSIGCNEQSIDNYKWCTPSYIEEARVKIETSGTGGCSGNSIKLKIAATLKSDTGDFLDSTFGMVKTTIYIIVGCVIGGIVLIIVVVVIIICCCCRKQNRGSTQGVVYQPAQGTVTTPNPYQPQPMANPYQPQPMATGYPPPSTEYPPPKAGY